MKQRAKDAHWLSEIFGHPDHLKMAAAIEDRRLDNKVGARMRGSRKSTPAPECDWRRLAQEENQ